MNPAFFTLGRMMTQFARANISGGTVLLSTIALNTAAAFLSVSSSLALSAHAGASKTIDATNTLNDRPAIENFDFSR
jgi:hypothetical protein